MKRALIITLVLLFLLFSLTFLSSLEFGQLDGVQNSDQIQSEAWGHEVQFEQGSIRFKGTMKQDAELKIDPHYENIWFGELDENAILLPLFWDISLSPSPSVYSARIWLQYNEDILPRMGWAQEPLLVFKYDMEAKRWDELDVVYDQKANGLEFETSELGRFAIGFYMTTYDEY